MSDSIEREQPELEARKPYTPPALVVHGDVEKITGWKGFGSEDLVAQGDYSSGGSGFGGS